MLNAYFPNSASTLLAAYTNSLAQIPNGQAKLDGIAAGDEAAQAMIALRANDGSFPPLFKVPGPAVPGDWQATISCPIVNGIAQGTGFHWQNVTPFGIQSASSFLLGPPPALTSNEYAKAYNEVMTVGSANSTERRKIAQTSLSSTPLLRQLKCSIRLPCKSHSNQECRCPKTLALWP